ncbi:group II truncated hemoglobin [Aestuariibacter sp. AA17]|uniref:Group II truncated hemoglobin n=1 Tax=Fluctibacter corallii TaxID=2984329 RepID=A0ABT3AD32_9ALTE|nr:group II truncated hemoglobin [Aestuariibacter sp. AA17]MCV2886574.1 group II truncated hemoglobin [Aestuariibacter sp. AA17]
MKTPYIRIGGEEGVKRLVKHFYDEMETESTVRPLYDLHPKPLDKIRHKFFEYLSGWMGGPPLFEQKYGHPRLRARHMPYPINSELKDQWMLCMDRALVATVKEKALRDQLRQAFDSLAEHMINRK